MANAGMANASFAPGIGFLLGIFKLLFVFWSKSMLMLFVNEHKFLFYFFFSYLFIILDLVNLYWCLLICFSLNVLMSGWPSHRGVVPLRRSKNKNLFNYFKLDLCFVFNKIKTDGNVDVHPYDLKTRDLEILSKQFYILTAII